MGTQDESASTSIADDLRSAFDAADTETVTNDVQDAPEQTTSPEATDQTAQTLEELIEAPKHWPEQDRNRFGELSKIQSGKDWQKWMLDRHKSMEGDYTKKTQQFAEFKKTYEPIQKLVEPYMETLRQNNLTVPALFERYLQADKYLQESPVEALQWLAQSYGIDLAQVVNGQTDKPKVDPYVQKLEREINSLKSTFQSREQQEQQKKLNSTFTEITGFAEEKDASGNPARPYFNEVVDDMVLLAQAQRASGQTPKLQDLYDRAVWGNPEVRQKIIAAQKQAEAKQRADGQVEKASRAKKASASVSGSPGASAPRTDRTLREELEKQFG